MAVESNHRGWRIAVVGTGGQGVLTAARLLCEVFAGRGRHVVSGQLHGMAQRGGSVQASVIIDGGISPVISDATADFVLGLEPVETARAMPLMSPRTIVYMNTAPVVPFVVGQRSVVGGEACVYPLVADLERAVQSICPETFAFDATAVATAAGSPKALNTTLLGCLLASEALPCSVEDFWEDAERRIPSALRETNAAAFAQGVEAARAFQRERVR